MRALIARSLAASGLVAALAGTAAAQDTRQTVEEMQRRFERLRFTPGPTHSEAMMDELTKALVEIWGRLELELRKAA